LGINDLSEIWVPETVLGDEALHSAAPQHLLLSAFGCPSVSYSREQELAKYVCCSSGGHRRMDDDYHVDISKTLLYVIDRQLSRA
jgi:hypothetical protein